jgi:predicted metal-dependent HD superfamily phosphohydrolase
MIELPDTAAASAALDVATTYLSDSMLRHSLRVHVWAAAYGDQRGLGYDAELVFVAAMFHDLSLVPVFDSHTVAFEEASGHLARVFATGAGWSPARRERLGEVIVRHMWTDVDPAEDVEGHLLARAAAVDIVGRNVDDFTPAFRDEVLHRYPRDGLLEEFLACFQAQATRKPLSSAARAINSGLAERMRSNAL